MAWTDDLRDALPPPAGIDPDRPMHWADIERRIGVTVPDDYRTFIRLWGPGVLLDEVLFYGDVPSGHARDLARFARQVDDDYRALQEILGDPFDYPLLPARGAFLGFGSDGLGNFYGWIVGDGDAADWNVAVFENREPRASVFPGSFADFIAAFVRGAVDRLPRVHPSLVTKEPKTYRKMNGAP